MARQSTGKRIHGALYLHRTAIGDLSAKAQAAVNAAHQLAGEPDWNVVKLDEGKPSRLSLLQYEEFEASAFPALKLSITVDLKSEKVTRRRYGRDNPPILHRKELLLRHDDPLRQRFEALTAALEQRGLFRDAAGIGFKTAWEARLREAGVTVHGHALVASTPIKHALLSTRDVERHRTAIRRDTFSAPIQALYQHGLLRPELTVLDYGCGRGDDVRLMAAMGVSASGWDPFYAPDTPLEEADIVNLGFVLNVIEDPEQRTKTLRDAYRYSRRCLAIAVMTEGKADVLGLQSYGDGYVTSWGTFQKYYRQQELKAFIEDSLGEEAIAVAPGVFFVFRDKVLEQRFLLERQRRLSRVPGQPKERPHQLPDLRERLKALAVDVWNRALELGRAPALDELPENVQAEVVARAGSLTKLWRVCLALFEPEQLEIAAAARRQDLLVYFALNLFNRRQRYGQLPLELQRDVKTLFSNFGTAQREAEALLFSVGDPDKVREACEQAYDEGLGWLEEGSALTLHSSLVERLPAILRCYVGCASVLYGDVDGADLIKIHIRSGKLTLLFYEDFLSNPVPSLIERVKIDLRAQRISFFSYERDQQILLMKSRYLSHDHEIYDKQYAFDSAIAALGVFDLDDYGPPLDVFRSLIGSFGYTVSGFSLVAAT